VNIVDPTDHGRIIAEVVKMARGGADLVIECTGVPDAVGEGPRLPRRGGSYLVVGQYTDAGDAERVPLGRLVSTNPLEDHATALADIADGRS
jgi:threonine dehydrogenase-like Zn-dependent dehydrogenase